MKCLKSYLNCWKINVQKMEINCNIINKVMVLKFLTNTLKSFFQNGNLIKYYLVYILIIRK